MGYRQTWWTCPRMSLKISSGATQWCLFDWFVTCNNSTTVSSTSNVKRDIARLLQWSASDGYVVCRNVNCHYILGALRSTGLNYFMKCSVIGLEWTQIPAVTFRNLLAASVHKLLATQFIMCSEQKQAFQHARIDCWYQRQHTWIWRIVESICLDLLTGRKQAKTFSLTVIISLVTDRM